MSNASVELVFVAALLTAVATGLGALPLAFVKDVSRRWLGIGNAVAAGFMLGASSGLVAEGAEYGTGKVLVGVVVGIAAIIVSFRLLGHHHGEELIPGMRREAPSEVEQAERRRRRNALRGVMVVAVMTIHSFSEGVGVGVAYGGGETLGGLITVAMAVHNIPEGLAIALVLVPRGIPVLRAAGWAIFSSLPQPLMAVPAFVFVEQFRVLLPYGLGFAAGAMVWMSFSDLLPDAVREASKRAVLTAASGAIAIMVAFQYALLG